MGRTNGKHLTPQEREAILEVLARHSRENSHPTAAARELGIRPSTVRRLAKEAGVFGPPDRPSFEASIVPSVAMANGELIAHLAKRSKSHRDHFAAEKNRRIKIDTHSSPHGARVVVVERPGIGVRANLASRIKDRLCWLPHRLYGCTGFPSNLIAVWAVFFFPRQERRRCWIRAQRSAGGLSPQAHPLGVENAGDALDHIIHSSTLHLSPVWRG